MLLDLAIALDDSEELKETARNDIVHLLQKREGLGADAVEEQLVSLYTEIAGVRYWQIDEVPTHFGLFSSKIEQQPQVVPV